MGEVSTLMSQVLGQIKRFRIADGVFKSVSLVQVDGLDLPASW